MSWRYRVMRHTDPDGSHDFAIHEVYSDDETQAITGWTENSVGVSGFDFRQLTLDIARYQEALSWPVLAVETDGLFEIGCMGNSKSPKQVWKPRAGTVPALSHHSVTPSASAAPSQPVPQGWQPIETAPKDGVWILGGVEYATEGYWLNDMWWASCDAAAGLEPLSPQPTHWLPRPLPPTAPVERRHEDQETK